MVDSTITEDNLPWSRIAQYIPNRTGIQCQARWTEALDPSVRKGRWRKEEDDMLKVGVERFGCCWIRVAGSIPGRTQRQCRTRWNQIQSKRQKAQDGASKPATNAVKKQQRKRKRVDGDVVQWKASSQQQAIDALSATPIKLAVPDRTPYILLSKQPSNAIVIPSEILSPLPSPSTSLASSMEEDDYFCTSPASTCSADTFNTLTNDASTPLSALEASNLLDSFDSSFASFINEKPSNLTNSSNDMFSSLFSNEFLNQYEYNHAQPQHENAFSLEHLLLNSDLFMTHSSTNPTLLSS